MKRFGALKTFLLLQPVVLVLLGIFLVVFNRSEELGLSLPWSEKTTKSAAAKEESLKQEVVPYLEQLQLVARKSREIELSRKDFEAGRVEDADELSKELHGIATKASTHR